MRAIQIAGKDLMLRLRDYRALMLAIFSPFIILLILGYVFGPKDRAPVPIVVTNLDEGDLGKIYVSTLQLDQVKRTLNATVADSTEAAHATVDKGNAAVALIIPAGFTKGVYDAKPQQVEIYADANKPIGSAVARAVIEVISFNFSKNSALARTSLAGLQQTGRVKAEDVDKVAAQIAADVKAASGADGGPQLFSLNGEDVQARPSTSVLAYYGPAMLILFLMFNAIRAGGHLLEEREEGTLSRLLTAPLGRNTIVLGKVLGDFLVSGLLALVLLLGLRFLFDVDLGDPLAVALLIILLTLAIVALSIVVAGVIGTSRSAGGANQGVAMILGLIGGSVVQVSGSPWLNTLGKITPNYWALDGFLKLADHGGLIDILPNLGILAAMSIVLVLIGSRLVNTRLLAAS